MDVLFLVSHVESTPLLTALLDACKRRGIDYGCFFTGAAAALVKDPDIGRSLADASCVIVCEYSWERFGKGDCPFAIGSQTDNSALASAALHVVSL